VSKKLAGDTRLDVVVSDEAQQELEDALGGRS